MRQKTPLIWSFWLERISPTKRRDLRPFERNMLRVIGKTTCTAHSKPPERLILSPDRELSATCRNEPPCHRCWIEVLCWIAASAGGMEVHLGKGVSEPLSVALAGPVGAV